MFGKPGRGGKKGFETGWENYGASHTGSPTSNQNQVYCFYCHGNHLRTECDLHYKDQATDLIEVHTTIRMMNEEKYHENEMVGVISGMLYDNSKKRNRQKLGEVCSLANTENRFVIRENPK